MIESSMRAVAELPAPSPRVPWLLRWRLHRAGRADRRAGLPVGLSPETTPALAELVALYGHACERERTAYLAAEAELSVELRRLDARIDASRAEARRRADEVQRLTHPTAEDWLNARFPGEELLPAVATRTRRAVAHQRQLAQAQAEHHRALQDLDAAVGERAEVAATLRRRAEIARSRVQRHRQLTERMAAVYRRTLVTRHPERDQLVARWTTRTCTGPDWAEDLAPLPSEASPEVPA